jgi:hypothetical protein
MSKARTEFQNPTRLTQWVVVTIYALVAMIVINVILAVMSIQSLHEIDQSINEVTTNFSISQWTLTGQVVINVVAFVLSLIWIYRIHSNLRQFKVTGLCATPAWSVAWYFIPIANFFKPYEGMKEAWQASAAPKSWRSQETSGLLPWWWFTWIIASLIDRIANQYATRMTTIADIIFWLKMNIFSNLVWIVPCILFIQIVRSICQMQINTSTVMAEPMNDI